MVVNLFSSYIYMKYLIVKQLSIDNHFLWDIWFQGFLSVYQKIVTRKRGDGIYYFALWQTNNNIPNKLLLSESAVSCLLGIRSVSFKETTDTASSDHMVVNLFSSYIYMKYLIVKQLSIDNHFLWDIWFQGFLSVYQKN
jgi:predicted tellurium resistance membrane protein TerC